MSDHLDINERKNWNAFKTEYRKLHPDEIRNHHYYKRIRRIYRNQDNPTLIPWLSTAPAQNCIDKLVLQCYNHNGDRRFDALR